MHYAAQLEVDHPLDLPPLCACCGQKTKRTISLEPESTSKGEDIALAVAGALFHLVHVVKLFTKKTVRIPFCRRCRWNYILPSRETWLPIGGFTLLLCAGFCFMALERIALGLGLLFSSFVLLVFVAIKNTRHEARSMPMKVFYGNGRYRYLVHFGPFVEYFRAYPGGDLETLTRKLILRYNQFPEVVKI